MWWSIYLRNYIWHLTQRLRTTPCGRVGDSTCTAPVITVPSVRSFANPMENAFGAIHPSQCGARCPKKRSCPQQQAIINSSPTFGIQHTRWPSHFFVPTGRCHQSKTISLRIKRATVRSFRLSATKGGLSFLAHAEAGEPIDLNLPEVAAIQRADDVLITILKGKGLITSIKSNLQFEEEQFSVEGSTKGNEILKHDGEWRRSVYYPMWSARPDLT